MSQAAVPEMPKPIASMWEKIWFLAGLAMMRPPAWNVIDQMLWEKNPLNIPDVSTLALMKIRGHITEEQYTKLMKKMGFNEEMSGNILKAAARIFDLSEIIAMLRRGIITKDEADNRLIAAGVPKEDIDKLLKVSEYFPSPPDLIRFAVREVYTPTIVEKYRTDEDLPEEFITEAAKAGLPKEQAVNYWRAHWELPSVQLGLEMFHRLTANEGVGEGPVVITVGGKSYRRVIDIETLKTLLRTLDIMPYWRDKLAEIVYTPLTRVDVRRMYAAGVLTPEEVFKQYVELGYREEDATKMTEWTIKEYQQEQRDLTKSEIITAFKNDKISFDKGVELLMKLDYTQDDAMLLMSIASQQKTKDATDAEVDRLINLYLNGVIDLPKLQDRCNALGVNPFTVRKIVQKAIEKKEVSAKLPTKEDVQKWLKAKLIDSTQFVDLLKRLGYLPEHIKLYFKEITGKELVVS